VILFTSERNTDPKQEKTVSKVEDNKQIVATYEQRVALSNLSAARTYKTGWGKDEKIHREEVLNSLGGEMDVTLILDEQSRRVVGTINESEPSQSIEWQRFWDDHPELEAKYGDELRERYLKPATTSVKILTSWVEQQVPDAPVTEVQAGHA
jgi:hypothetical protein